MAKDTNTQGDFNSEMRNMSGLGATTLTESDTTELESIIDSATSTDTSSSSSRDNEQGQNGEQATATNEASNESTETNNVQTEETTTEPSVTPTETTTEEETKEEVKQPSETEGGVEEDPLEKEFPTPKHLNEEKRTNWKTLRQKAHNAEKSYNEIRQKYEEAVNVLAEFEKGESIPSTVKSELEELRQFRRMVDLANDPEFTSQYDKQIINEEDKIFNKLKGLGLSQEAVDTIIQGGGILSKTKDEWGRLIFGHLKGEEYEFARAELKDAINKVYSLGEEREVELKKAAQNYDQFTMRRQQELQQREAKDFEQIKSEVEAIQKQIPWANEPKKPVNPTPEAMAKYQKEASQWEQNTKRFHMYLNPPDAKTRAQAALAATGYFKVTEDMKALQAENATLRNQIAKLQSVGKTTTAQAPAPKPAPKKDYLGMDDADALDALMKEMGH